MSKRRDDVPKQGDLWGSMAPRRPVRGQSPAGPPAADSEPPAPPKVARGARQRPFSVRDLVRLASAAVEKAVGTVWVEGEIWSLSRPSSGHLYFALKDDRSQIRAVMWRSDARRLQFRLEDGLRLRCRGRLGFYERDGKFQLYVQMAEPAGLGADALALAQLKRTLAEEGLFDTARKRPIPALPRRIGVVTSKSGAAVRDIIRAVQRRFPVPILVADTKVQGPGAPREIARAIAAIGRTDVDVVIVGRGGGSASDLSAFDDEVVVRAIAACPIPTISAVGHEVDTSLSDLVADQRAATPTMAGEMAVPVREELADRLTKQRRRLEREWRLVVAGQRQEIDQLAIAAAGHMRGLLAARRRQVDSLARRVVARNPRTLLASNRAAVIDLESRARTAMRRRLDASARRFASLTSSLEALSPLRVLDRSYAIATKDGRVLHDVAEVSKGDALQVRLARGVLDCTVDDTHPDSAAAGASPAASPEETAP